MILAIDVGNSNIVLGCFEDNNILMVERLSTDRHCTALEFAVKIKTVLDLNGYTGSCFTGAIISSVVPSVTNMLRIAVEKLIGKTPLIVGPGLKTGLKIQLDNATQLGSDRVADAVGALAQYAPPMIIIDMGTATTLSVINEEGCFIGGTIMPGLQISMDALAQRTSQLPQISLDPPKKVIGRNTADCMRSGIINGNAAALDGLIDMIQAELGHSCTLVSTGGLSKLVIPYCKHKIAVDDQLLLKGLMYLYDKNDPDKKH